MGYLKVWRNVGSIKHQMHVINAIEAYAVQRQVKDKCFNYNKSGYLHR